MKRSIQLSIVILLLFLVSACAKPQFEVLNQTDSMIRYKHINSEKAREQMAKDAHRHCLHAQKNEVHGKTFCDSGRCETSYFCE